MLNMLKCIAVLVAMGAPAAGHAADATDPNNPAAAARDNTAPPEKVAPNIATAPGVMAPKPTPDAKQMAAPGSAAPRDSESGTTPPRSDLSEKLNKANGVIHPNNNIDPAIEKPLPAQGSMPVIRPPSAESGVQAK